jgi:hypothetical protein
MGRARPERSVCECERNGASDVLADDARIEACAPESFGCITVPDVVRGPLGMRHRDGVLLGERVELRGAAERTKAFARADLVRHPRHRGLRIGIGHVLTGSGQFVIERLHVHENASFDERLGPVVDVADELHHERARRIERKARAHPAAFERGRHRARTPAWTKQVQLCGAERDEQARIERDPLTGASFERKVHVGERVDHDDRRDVTERDPASPLSRARRQRAKLSFVRP